jgi:hypothetical protein
MAQINKQNITLGGSRIVGNVWVDGGAVRGEGGAAKPQLVVPLTIQMSNTPIDAGSIPFAPKATASPAPGLLRSRGPVGRAAA